MNNNEHNMNTYGTKTKQTTHTQMNNHNKTNATTN